MVPNRAKHLILWQSLAFTVNLLEVSIAFSIPLAELKAAYTILSSNKQPDSIVEVFCHTEVLNRNARCYGEFPKILSSRQWSRSGVFIVNFEHISHRGLVFLSLTLRACKCGWVISCINQFQPVILK